MLIASVRAEAAGTMRLALAVTINGYETKLIGNFAMDAGQRLIASRNELRELGLQPGAGPDGETMRLDTIEGLTYQYNAEQQSLDIKVGSSGLAIQKLGQVGQAETDSIATRDPGIVINYGITTAISDDELKRISWDRPTAWQQFATLSLDTRLFGPWGMVVNTGVLGTGPVGQENFLRLDTTWSWSDPARLATWSAGDVTTRGPGWARSIRIGGLQWRTNFVLRPDLVTVPQPEFRGTASVPSTVDVFINNTKAYSGEVRPGPFHISNIPVVTGAGNAQIVIRDSAGRETVQSGSFYTSPNLLRAGLFEHSVEAGFARRNYGVASGDYSEQPVGSASMRYGYSDGITIEAHAEGGQNIANGGIGLAASILDRAVVSIATAASTGATGSGTLVRAGLDTKFGPLSLNLSTQRTFGQYKDLAAHVLLHPTKGFGTLASLDPPRALDVATVSVPFGPRGGSLSTSMINRDSDNGSARIVAASYSLQMLGRSTLLVSGFHDIQSNASTIFAGLSVPLGDYGHAHATASFDHTQPAIGIDYLKTASREPGSVGWRLSEQRGQKEARAGSMTYQSSFARIETGVEQIGAATRFRTLADGALVLTAHGAILANRIEDAFAMVEVGEPGVPVKLENQIVAVTNSNGVALVPGLRSYQSNRIEIDPDALPIDVVATRLRDTVVPGDRSGATVRLATRKLNGNAVVVFRRSDGQFVEPGAQGSIEGSGQTFVVGYDGRAYLEGLAGHNQVTISAASGTCVARFSFQASAHSQVLVKNVVCS